MIFGMEAIRMAGPGAGRRFGESALKEPQNELERWTERWMDGVVMFVEAKAKTENQ